MPASSVYDLYKFETVVETAATASLIANGITSSLQRSPDTTVTPIVDVQCQMGSARNHFQLVNGIPENDMWDGNLILFVKTNTTHNGTEHPDMVAKVRRIFRNNDALNSGSLMPYHQIVDLNEIGTSPQIAAEDNLDISGITYGFVIAIKPDAWPT